MLYILATRLNLAVEDLGGEGVGRRKGNRRRETRDLVHLILT